MEKVFKKFQWMKIAVIAMALLFITTSGWAAKDYYLYDRQEANDVTTNNAPVAEGWSVAMCYLPATTTTALRGRMVAATGTKVYLQDAVDSGSWTKVAETVDAMDASFIKVSPDGTTVALGQGYGMDLLVFPLSLLTSGSTPNLTNHASTTTFDSDTVKYYDAAWADDTHLLINGGNWDAGAASTVGISCLDITSDANDPVNIISNTSYPGASSGIAVDSSNNLIFGNGYTYETTSATGELVMLPAADWWDGSAPKSSGLPVAYSTADKFADSVLSAAYLGFDQEGNLHVGGGQFVSGTNTENGYAVLINKQVIIDTADSNVALYQIDETDATQYREIEGDSCRNDTATGVLSYGRAVTVNWIDGSGACSIGGCTDYWGSGIISKLTVFRVDAAYDGDGDSFNDVVDNSPWTNHNYNTDTDGDGYGNIIDADFNNDGTVNLTDLTYFQNYFGTTDANADLDSSGNINLADLVIFQNLYGEDAPYYNY